MKMAEGKKSFVAYADWRDTFNELTDEDAGKLVKHIFAYVNDENPTSDSVVVKAVFAQIKNTLKRDLSKWESQVEQRRAAGKKSAELRATKSNDRSTTVNERTRNSTDSVSVSDSVNEKKDNNISTFLEWFNVQKEVHTGKKGAFKTLSTTDVNNLKQLKRVYEETDFDVAFVGMASNPWVKENGAMNPAHFLRVDNFNRYLDSGVKRLPALSRIAAHTAVQSGGSILQGYIDKGYTIEEIQNYAK
jgi:hypothetical protein